MEKSLIISSMLAVTFSLTGCASIIDGSTEEVMINTNPPGASCSLERLGHSIGRISPTPGAVTIKKTKDDITIVCTKKKYQKATYFERSGSQGATWGNIIAGGGIGWAIDSAAGADNYYETPVNITLIPN